MLFSQVATRICYIELNTFFETVNGCILANNNLLELADVPEVR